MHTTHTLRFVRRALRRGGILSLLACCAFVPAPAQTVGFTDVFTPANWVFTSGGAGSTVTWNNDNTAFTLTGSLTGSNSTTLTTFKVDYLSAYRISFDWAFTTADPSGPNWDPAGFNSTQLSNSAGANTQSGRVTDASIFSVLQFYAASDNWSDPSDGRSTLTISNFSFTADGGSGGEGGGSTGTTPSHTVAWSGATGSWTTAANWTGGVPDATAQANITDNAAVAITGAVDAHSVYVERSTLTISGSGALTTTDGYSNVALDYGATLNVTGTDARWTGNSLTLYTATANFESGAIVSTLGASLANFGDNTATANILTGATWNAGHVSAGNGGAATINVQSGATLTATDLSLGSSPGGTGTLNVAGSGTQVNADFLKVGEFAPGNLAISGGAVVTSTGAAIAYGSANGAGDVVGTALVTGTGSQWKIGGDLGIGDYLDSSTYNFGTLTVASGGLVRVGTTGTGTVTLRRGGTLNLGNGGTSGTLEAGAIAFDYASGTVYPTVAFNHTDTLVFAPLISGRGRVTKAGSGTLVLTADNTYTNGGTAVNAGTLQLGDGGTAGTIAGAVSVASGATLAFNRSNAHTFSGIISGAGGVVQRGTNTLTLSGANTFTGGVVVESGTLRATTNTGALGAGTVTLNGGNLTLANNTALNLGRATTLAADATITSDRGTNSGNGVTHTLGTLSLGAQTLTIAAGGRVTGGTAGVTFGATTLTGNAAFAVGSSAQLNLGAVGGNYSLTKSGAGTLALTAAGTYTGGTTVTGGLVSFTSNLNRFGTGNITLNGGGLLWGSSTTLDVSGRLNALGAAGATFNTGGNNVTFATALTGSGGLTKAGAGTLTLNAANSYTGGTTVTGGLISFTDLNRFGTGNITLNGGGLLWGTGTTLDVSSRLNALGAAGATFNLGSNNVTLAGALTGTGGITKSGTGVLTLTGNNTFAGGVTISAGSVLGSGTNPFGTGPITPGTSTSLGAAGNGTLTLGNELAGTATSSLAGSGTLILTNAANSFWTMSINSGGTLVAAANGALGSTAGQINVNTGTLAFSGGINYSSAKTVTFTGNGAAGRNGAIDNLSGHNTFAGNLSLSGTDGRIGAAADTSLTLTGTIGQQIAGWGVTYSGPGTVIVTGDNTYSGATTVAQGTLAVNNTSGSGTGSGAVTVQSGAMLRGSGSLAGLATLQSGAHLAPGNSPGTLTFAGGLTLADGAILDFELGSTSDLIRVTGGTLTGSASAGGITLNLANAGGFTAASYTLFDFSGASTSSFDISDFTFGSKIAGYTYSLALVGNTLQLTALAASAVPEPSTYAALAGLAALALVVRRRRTR